MGTARIDQNAPTAASGKIFYETAGRQVNGCLENSNAATISRSLISTERRTQYLDPGSRASGDPTTIFLGEILFNS